jgi:cell division cycle 14
MATDGEELSVPALLSSGLAVELIPDRLYFASFGCHPQSTHAVTFFSTDHVFQYSPYFADFGPLNISNVVRFAKIADGYLRDRNKTVIFYSSHSVHHRANAACLAACYCVAVHKLSPAAVCAAFRDVYPPLLPFRDASFGVSTYNITLKDVVCGLAKAMDFGWFDVASFDVEAYDRRDAAEAGDWNVVVPKLVVAFSSPVEGLREVKVVAKDFRDYGVKCIVRLNEPLYDRRDFLKSGFDHVDIVFADGGVPADSDMQRFHDTLAAAHKTGGSVAVHCKAGLGRTGTMICSWMMRVHGFTSREAIGWCRLCRPGSVMGVQQSFLERLEDRLIRQEKQARPRPSQLAPIVQYRKLVTLSQPPAAGSGVAHAKRRATMDASALRYAQQEAEITLVDQSFVPQKTATAKLKFKTSKMLVGSSVADAVDRQALMMALGDRAHQPAAACSPARRGSVAGTPVPSNPTPTSLLLSNCGSRAASSMSMNLATLQRSRSPIGTVEEVLPAVMFNTSRSPLMSCDSVDPGWATATARPVRYNSSQ